GRRRLSPKTLMTSPWASASPWHGACAGTSRSPRTCSPSTTPRKAAFTGESGGEPRPIEAVRAGALGPVPGRRRSLLPAAGDARQVRLRRGLPRLHGGSVRRGERRRVRLGHASAPQGGGV